MNGLDTPHDADAAAWLPDAGDRIPSTVGDLLAAPFEAYARVFHPAALGGRPVGWARVARHNGAVLHPGAEWGSLVGSWQLRDQAAIWDAAPIVGVLPPQLADALIRVVSAPGGADQRCWFGFWEGHGGVADEFPAAPRFTVASRTMLLMSGRVSDATRSWSDGFLQTAPTLWWPDDRCWCVATDIDLMSTYVGGTTELVARLIAASGIEALPVAASQRLAWDTDTVNPLPAPP